MRVISLILVTLLYLTPIELYSSQNFDISVPPGGEILASKELNSISLQYKKLTFDKIMKFYQNELNNEADIKWENLEEQSGIKIHDWGSREWHTIKITENSRREGVIVTIRKDNWTWIIGTLIIRYVGVFVVLIVLMIALYITGVIISRTLAKIDEPKTKPSKIE